MSLSQLSPKSLVKVFECLDSQGEPGTTALLRRTSFELNKLAKANEFDKINVMEVRLHPIRSRNHINLRRAVITNTVVTLLQKIGRTHDSIKYLDFSTPPFSHIQYNDDAALADILPLGYAPQLLRRYNDRFIQKQTYKNETEKDAVIFKMLSDAFDKVRTFGMFSLFEVKIDSEFLAKLKALLLNVSRDKTSVLNIQRCVINLTSDELAELLDLFPNAKSICLDGTFKDAIVTDKHIRRATKSLRVIHDPPKTKNVVERDFYPLPTYSEITKNAITERNGRYPKNIILDGFYSNISFSSISKIMSYSLQLSAPNNKRVKIDSTMYIGSLIGTDELNIELAKAQRNKKFRWNIYKTTRRTRIYQIYGKNSNIVITFCVLEPRKDPDFNRLRNEVIQLRDELNSLTPEESSQLRRQVKSKVTEVNWDLYEYEWTNKLPNPQITGGELRMLNDEYRESFHSLLVQMRRATELDSKSEPLLMTCNPLMHKVDRMMDYLDGMDDDIMILGENGVAIEFMDDNDEHPEVANLADIENEIAEQLNNQLDDLLDRENLLGDFIPDRQRNVEQQKLRLLNNLNNAERKLLQYRIAQLEATTEEQPE